MIAAGLTVGIFQSSLIYNPISPPRVIAAPVINPIEDGTAEIHFNEALATMTIAGTDRFDGQYTVPLSVLALGPANLVPTSLETLPSVQVGDTVRILPGLWVFDAQNGPASVTYSTSGNGTIDALNYVVQSSDASTAITFTEYASDSSGTRLESANVVIL